MLIFNDIQTSCSSTPVHQAFFQVSPLCSEAPAAQMCCARWIEPVGARRPHANGIEPMGSSQH